MCGSSRAPASVRCWATASRASRRRPIMPTSISDPDKIKADILREAAAQGFDLVRVTRAEGTPQQGAALGDFLSAGHHGDMDWMEARRDWRADPAVLWPQARSVLVLGLNYGPDDNPLALLDRKEHGAISV